MRTADFERVLATPARSRSAHFAAHYLAARPMPGKQHAPIASKPKLSTDGARVCPPAVDEAPNRWWLGLVVPRRHARRAVTRNLVKRQMRAQMVGAVAALPSGAVLPCGLWVLRLKAPIDRAQYPSAASTALRDAVRGELALLLATAAARAVRRPSDR